MANEFRTIKRSLWDACDLNASTEVHTQKDISIRNAVDIDIFSPVQDSQEVVWDILYDIIVTL